MSKVFFKLQKTGLADYDLTPWIDIQNYAVNAVPVYNEWTDANYRLHRHYVRDRVGGSFAVGFAKKADFDAFLSALSTYQTDGVYTVSAYVNANGSRRRGQSGSLSDHRGRGQVGCRKRAAMADRDRDCGGALTC